MRWSEYQDAIFEAVESVHEHGRDLVVLARAGTGKTTTMVEAVVRYCRRNRGRKVLTCAFNVKNAKDLDGKLSAAGLDWRTAAAKTLNAVGLATVRKAWGKAVEVDAKKGRDCARAACAALPAVALKVLSPAGKVQRLATLAKITLTDPSDLRALEEFARRYAVADEAEEGAYLARLAGRALELSAEDRSRVDFDDQLWFPHFFGLTPWQYDLVVVDEAQDMNPAQLELARNSVRRGGRLAAVGDDRQCQPTGTKVLLPGGIERPIEELRDGDAVVAWDRRSKALVGRDRPIYRVNVSRRDYSGDLIEVKVDGERLTRCTPTHRWTVKTVRDDSLRVVYLMRRGNSYRIGTCQLFGKNGELHLSQRTRLERADTSWILSIHRSKRSAHLAEALASHNFGIPMLQFAGTHVGSPDLYTQEFFDKFWATLGNLEDRALVCLEAFGREFLFPFYRTPAEGETYGRSTVLEVVAANLFPEFMRVPVPSGGKSIEYLPFKISKRSYRGWVYSLDVPRVGHYVADGIVTHNSIYGWRAADSNFLSRMIDELGARTLPLPRTYRCATSIVAEARRLVPDYEAAAGNEAGTVRAIRGGKLLAEVTPGDFVLCRANAPLLPICLELLRRRVPAAIQGRDVLGQLLGTIQRAEERGCATSADLSAWLDGHEADERRKLLEKDAEEELLEALADRCACLRALLDVASDLPDLRARLEELFSDVDDASRVTLSTAHRAKGLERDRVFLLRDSFREGGQESNCLYVAITRARNELVYVQG